MRQVYALYLKKKNSKLDRAISSLQKDLRFNFVKLDQVDILKDLAKGSIVIVRHSELVTSFFEDKLQVVPSEQSRTYCKNKWKLYNYCQNQKISTPATFTTDELLQKYVFKFISGSNISIIDHILNNAVLIQERIPGQVVKIYGTRDYDYYGFDEKTKESVFLPDKIKVLSDKVFKYYDLLIGGLDFIIHDNNWYLIDVNATTGLNFAPFETVLELTKKALQALL